MASDDNIKWLCHYYGGLDHIATQSVTPWQSAVYCYTNGVATKPDPSEYLQVNVIGKVMTITDWLNGVNKTILLAGYSVEPHFSKDFTFRANRLLMAMVIAT